jgi:hypothetical protein
MTDHAIYEYVPHYRTQTKIGPEIPGPVKVAEQFPHGSAAARFNGWFAVKVTRGVGTMWCAYAFAALACVGLPSAISSHSPVVPVSWISQTFLQLVLLSVIIVGQNVLAAAADKRSEATFQDGDAVLHESVKLQEHLLAQDEVLTGLVDRGWRRGSPERGCVASAVEGPPTVRFRIIAESPPDGAALYPVRPGVTGCPVRCRVRGRPRSWRWSGVGGSDPSPRCGRRRRRREGPCARGGHVSCRRQGAT